MKPMTARGYALQLIAESPLAAEAVFPRDYPGFDGHFPDGAILPGFVHVQLALDVLREAGLACELLELQDAKFIAPILPEMPVRVTVSPAGQAGRYEIIITADEGGVCSSFALLAR